MCPVIIIVFWIASQIRMIPQSTLYENMLQIDEENAPHEYLCPISREIMKNPVITLDGYSFQSEAIQKWFKQRDKSPITGLKIEKKTIQNRALKQAIKFHNQRQAKANENAQKLLETTNSYISSTIPDLINDAGLLDLDKLVAIAIENVELKKALREIAGEFRRYDGKEREEIEGKACEGCYRYREGWRRVGEICKKAENVVEAQPIISDIKVQAKEFQYLPLSVNELKRIDFCQLKLENWKTKFFKSYGIQKCSLETLVKRIKNLNKIPQNNFTQIWKVSIPVSELYQTIKKQLSHQKCTYKSKIMQLGTKIPNTKTLFDQIDLKPGQYLIIEYGNENQYVFRGENVKCQYCYEMKSEKIKCQCEAVSYCSMQCGEKDRQYHGKRCVKGSGALLKAC